MDELTGYILNNYGDLMTAREAAAQTTARATIILSGHAEYVKPTERRNKIEEKFISKDSDVLVLLADGLEDCLYNIRNRILRDNADKVFLNYCPRCQKLARTPWAKQCQHCFFSWHDLK